MYFAHDEKTQELIAELEAFMAERIVPSEPAFHAQLKELDDRWAWSETPVLRKILGTEDSFRLVNARNKMEGGPKGVAVHANELAVCGPEYGIRIYSLSECR